MTSFFTTEIASDKAYSICRDHSSRKDFKNYIENLWTQYQQFADDNFLSEAKKQFHQRTWEMYLACTFIEHKIQLYEKDNKGPDIKFKIDGKIAWCEAVAITKGSKGNAVPDMHVAQNLSEVISQKVPEEKMILRITHGIEDKHKKYKKYLKNGIIKKDAPYIIALNRYETSFIDPINCPLILKALFGIGHQAINKNGTISWTRRHAIKKKNGRIIHPTYFENPKYSGISAIIYETKHVISLQEGKMGNNFIIVHNPLANTPIPRNLMKVKKEY